MKNQVVGVIGLGYVGLPLLLAVSKCGYRGLGFDIQSSRVNMLNAGRSYLKSFSDEDVQRSVRSGNLVATEDMARLSECDAILICVQTPLTRNRNPDLRYVVETVKSIARYQKKDQLIVLESTTYPGTTEEIVLPILESNGMVCGKDFYLAYSPEREDPGNKEYHTGNVPKIIGGIDECSRDRAIDLYKRFVKDVVPVSSTSIAEAAKLTENIFRAVNIGLVNELKIVFDQMGIDIFEVIDAAKTKPFGYMPFYPGPGLGGHCISIDPYYLTWKAREYRATTRIIELAGEINNLMPDYVVQRTALALDTQCGKGLNGSHILVIGVAYKANVDDTRESPSLQVIELLKKRKARVEYYDPLVPEIDGEYIGRMHSIDRKSNTYSEFDAVVICTNHDSVNWQEVVDYSNLIVDTRNATKNTVFEKNKIFK